MCDGGTWPLNNNENTRGSTQLLNKVHGRRRGRYAMCFVDETQKSAKFVEKRQMKS